MAKGDRLSLYEKVYRELDSTFIGAERQRNVPGKSKDRYDYMEIGVDGKDNIVIRAATAERLDFAEKVAQYYGAPYVRLEEPWRHFEDERYTIKINISEPEK